MYNVLSENSVYHNVKAKIYPDGTKKIVLCNKPIFKDPGFEVLNRSDNMPDVKISKPKNMANSVRYDSIRRSKEKVFDIALINTFSYFVTWTLDSKKIDRYNPKEVSKKLRCFLNHKVQRNDLNYLIIPEYHKTALYICMDL